MEVDLGDRVAAVRVAQHAATTTGRTPGLLPRYAARRMQIERQAAMLANRVRKNFRRLHPAFERRGVGAFRVYDWDVPEIRATIDWYEGHLVVAEYARRQTDAEPRWLPEIGRAAAEALGVEPGRVHLRRRRTRPESGERYSRLSNEGARIEVRESGLRFIANLTDYLDTGLFPDHRDTRARVRAESAGASFLNLFGYTGTFTCAAAAGGARESVTVDASPTYLRWAEDNLRLNGLSGAHELAALDVRDYLRETKRRFTLCVLDPPSFSTRAGSASLDVQRDHPALVGAALEVLEPGGVLYFSTNHQRFEPRLDRVSASEVREITDETAPADYRHTPHRCFRLVR
jgi:23S rRNA G2069 N7-methylase RlmK/C1962 C5-methylase RlmI